MMRRRVGINVNWRVNCAKAYNRSVRGTFYCVLSKALKQPKEKKQRTLQW